VELVKPMHNPDFCRYCDRLRVTSRGELKPCLLRYDNHVDILKAIRSGADREYLRKLFLEAIARRKPYFL
ncbi:MAG: GTP 3',8-cyclase MoaA, partial [Candidatus Bathyarchaeota archaeon]|nr:GTP 3',8-cyclase MoaA [Candidatus Bathyarchaeota archaeon]